MWKQGFPEDEKSPEALVLAHTFCDSVAAAKRGNTIGIVCMAALIWRQDLTHFTHSLSIILAAANFFALAASYFLIPQAEQRHGILYAHRTFVRISATVVFVTFCVAIPVAMWSHGAYFNSEREVHVGSPLICVILSALALIMISLLHLNLFPLKYRAVVHIAIAIPVLAAPSYSQLGHMQEVLILLLALALSEVIGVTVQRTLQRSVSAAQADQKNLTRRLEEIDAEREQMIKRLEQIDGEKVRLTYELLIEQQRGAKLSPVAVPCSSYGSESELNHMLAAPTDAPEAIATRRGSDGRDRALSAMSAESDSNMSVNLSAGMRQRLNASLMWMSEEAGAS